MGGKEFRYLFNKQQVKAYIFFILGIIDNEILSLYLSGLSEKTWILSVRLVMLFIRNLSQLCIQVS